jgi:hypothetical protein
MSLFRVEGFIGGLTNSGYHYHLLAPKVWSAKDHQSSQR